jgi:2'-5' RNA ligase
MRLFLALRVPYDVQDAVAAYYEEWRSKGCTLEFQKLSKLHIILRFLGETSSPVDLHSIQESLRRPGRLCTDHFLIRLQGLGTFPTYYNPSFPQYSIPPKVLWIGVGGHVSALRQLKTQADAALGIRPQDSYNPHITLARPTVEQCGEVQRLVKQHEHVQIGREWRVEYLYLLHREVKGDDYEQLGEFPITSQRQLSLL